MYGLMFKTYYCGLVDKEGWVDLDRRVKIKWSENLNGFLEENIRTTHRHSPSYKWFVHLMQSIEVRSLKLASAFSVQPPVVYMHRTYVGAAMDGRYAVACLISCRPNWIWWSSSEIIHHVRSASIPIHRIEWVHVLQVQDENSKEPTARRHPPPITGQTICICIINVLPLFPYICYIRCNTFIYRENIVIAIFFFLSLSKCFRRG